LISKFSENTLLSTRNFGIDLARTLAISMVILVHTTGIGFGRFGVQLFFVISGYLLGKFYETQTKSQFLIHRAFRLFPLSIFFILFFYFEEIGSLKNLFLNLTLSQNLWWNWGSFPGGWSISSEWLFSIILLSITPVKKKALYLILFTCCTLQLVSGLYVYSLGGVSEIDAPLQYMFKTWLNTTNPFINLGFFIIGILIRHSAMRILKLSNLKLFLIVIIMIIEDQIVGHFMLGWQIAIPALFILCLKTRSRQGGLASICTFIGKRTYGTFFVHFLIWNNLNLFFSETQVNYLVNDPLGKFIQFIFVYLLALMGGTLTYRLIEKPSLSLSHKIIKKS
jgi:peptidoglycan/LPS O-acetylase OafA/YrhL